MLIKSKGWISKGKAVVNGAPVESAGQQVWCEANAFWWYVGRLDCPVEEACSSLLCLSFDGLKVDPPDAWFVSLSTFPFIFKRYLQLNKMKSSMGSTQLIVLNLDHLTQYNAYLVPLPSNSMASISNKTKSIKTVDIICPRVLSEWVRLILCRTAINW